MRSRECGARGSRDRARVTLGGGVHAQRPLDMGSGGGESEGWQSEDLLCPRAWRRSGGGGVERGRGREGMEICLRCNADAVNRGVADAAEKLCARVSCGRTRTRLI